MKTIKKMNLAILCLGLLFSTVSLKCFSQQYNLDNASSELKVYGTSSLHDWHLDTENHKGYITIDKNGDLTIDKLKIEVVSESLKSGKKGMDKNTYKSLATDKYKTISFQSTEIKSVNKVSDTNYKVESYGDLTIAGVKKRVSLNFTLNLTNGKVQLMGEKSFKMTDFNIEPPTALLGTITTGDAITIKFNTTLISQ